MDPEPAEPSLAPISPEAGPSTATGGSSSSSGSGRTVNSPATLAGSAPDCANCCDPTTIAAEDGCPDCPSVADWPLDPAGPAVCCDSLPLPFATGPGPKSPQRLTAADDCSECAHEAPTSHHLAWCCDDAGCLPPSQSAPGPDLAPDHSLHPAPAPAAWDACCAVGPSPPAPAAGIVTEEWMRWSAAALASAPECSDPHCAVAMSPTAQEVARDCPTCFGEAGSPSSGRDSTSGPTLDVAKGLLSASAGATTAEGLPHADLDELLNGLDEATIQDILNCCCCDTALHEEPATFDPASHTQHQRLPQHIHCHAAHDAVGGALPGAELLPSPPCAPPPVAAVGTAYPSDVGAALPPAPLQLQPSHGACQAGTPVPASIAAPYSPAHSATPETSTPYPAPLIPAVDGPLRCEWRDCTFSFYSHELLVAHVLSSHLVPLATASGQDRTHPHRSASVPQASGARGLAGDAVQQLLEQMAASVYPHSIGPPPAGAPAAALGSHKQRSSQPGLDVLARAVLSALSGGSTPSSSWTSPAPPPSAPFPSHPAQPHHPAYRLAPSHAAPSQSPYGVARLPHNHLGPHRHRRHHHHAPSLYGAAQAQAAAVIASRERDLARGAVGAGAGAAEGKRKGSRTPGPVLSSEGVHVAAAEEGTSTTEGEDGLPRKRRLVRQRTADDSRMSLEEAAVALPLPSPASLDGQALPVRSRNMVSRASLPPAGPKAGPSQRRSPSTPWSPSVSLLSAPASSLAPLADNGQHTPGGAEELEAHPCLWHHCPAVFSSTAALMEHLSAAHVGSGKARYTCEWEGCDRSTRVACPMTLYEEESEEDEVAFERRREARTDAGTFRQRQKIMRHLQMHTGDKPYACELCGKTFSEAHTLNQHMRTHTQEKPHVCDFPGCGKAFPLASALTIHQRTHTDSRPFPCPYPSCTATFRESSALGKHLRVHAGERRYVCEVEGCGKAFGRGDLLKRHGKVHERRRGEGAEVGIRDGVEKEKDRNGGGEVEEGEREGVGGAEVQEEAEPVDRGGA